MNRPWGFNGFDVVNKHSGRLLVTAPISTFYRAPFVLRVAANVITSAIFAQAPELSNDAVFVDSRTLSPKLMHRIPTKVGSARK